MGNLKTIMHEGIQQYNSKWNISMLTYISSIHPLASDPYQHQYVGSFMIGTQGERDWKLIVLGILT